MNTLDRKLARDLWRLRAPLGAVAVVMGAGVAALIMAWSTGASLRQSRDTYYADGRFADVFVQVKRAPESVADRLADISGVSVIHTRLVHDVTVSVPGLREAASVRLVSLPDNTAPALNAVLLRRGRLPESRTPEVVASEPFASANRLELGDTVGAVINGKWQTLSIVGIGLAPEFVYFVRPGEMLTDNRRSGVFWMPRSSLEEALGMEGAFNDAVVKLSIDAIVPEVIRQIDTVLDRYGGFGAYDRTDHTSDRYLRDEFDQLAVMGTWTPAIFLSVGAFLVHVVLGRLVRTQREQLATLKAFGYSTAHLARHLLLMATVMCAAATAIGVTAGWALGVYLTTFYIDVFRFPHLDFRLNPAAIGTGIAFTAAASTAGVLGALRAIARLSPAEAMRPEAPEHFRPTIVERLGVRAVPVRWRIAIRVFETHPYRATFAALGIGMSAAVLILSSFALDCVDYMIDREYAAGHRYDISITFNEVIPDSGIHSFRGLLAGDAFLIAEPVRAAGARLGNRQIRRTTAIIGLEPDTSLLRLMDKHGAPVELPPDGLLISEHLAEILQVGRGDLLHVELLDGRRAHPWVRVTDTFSGLVGLTVYMQRDALNRMTGDGHVISGMLARENTAISDELQQRLKHTPRIASITNKKSTLFMFREMISQNITTITIIHTIFAGLIAIGVSYNIFRISFLERQRELATLRVLGFTRTDVSRILFGEIALLTSLGIPFGLILGRGLAWSLIRTLQTESYSLPLAIFPRTYAFATIVTAAAATCSIWIIRRGVAKLDLLSTLKENG